MVSKNDEYYRNFATMFISEICRSKVVLRKHEDSEPSGGNFGHLPTSEMAIFFRATDGRSYRNQSLATKE